MKLAPGGLGFCSNAVVVLLLINCLLYLPFFWGLCVLFWYALLRVISSFETILTGKREHFGLLLLSF